jgi:hypothetical protein
VVGQNFFVSLRREKLASTSNMIEDYIKNLIFTVRGLKVMIDSDLAEIYGYETRTFNQQVKNNIQKFDDDFRFQLTKEEYEEILMSKFLTTKLNAINSLSDDNQNDEILISKNLTSSISGSCKQT